MEVSKDWLIVPADKISDILQRIPDIQSELHYKLKSGATIFNVANFKTKLTESELASLKMLDMFIPYIII